MRTPPHATPDDIDIGVLWTSLKRSLPRLLLLSALAGAATFGVMSMMAPRFTSEAQLSVVAKGRQNPFADPKRETAAPDSVAISVDKEAINTHINALRSPDLARRIADEMKLGDKVEFNSALGSVDALSGLLRALGMAGPRPGESAHDRVLGAYFRNLEVYSPKESRFIGIRFTSVDPELAAEVANRIAETYRSSLASMRVVETDEVQKALEPKIAELLRDVAAAESEVERFRGQADRFVGGPQRTALVEQQLGELTAELTRTAAARAEVEGRARSARELLKSGSAEVLPDVQRSPLIQSLVQSRVRAERQIAELSVTLLPGHPRMQQLHADLAGLKRQIAGEVTKLIEGLEKEAKAAALREDAVQKSIDALKSKVVSTGGDDVKLRALEAAAKSKRAELERLQAQFEANKARATPGAVPVEAQIITHAHASSVPMFPRKGPYSALIAAATLLFGLAWTISKALFTGARSRLAAAGGHDGHAHISTPPFRVDPALATPRGGAPAPQPAPASVILGDPAPRAAMERGDGDRVASVLDAATRIVEKSPARGGFRVLVTGTVAKVDGSADAIELAELLSDAQKQVILVDWSLATGGIAARTGVRPAPGLSDLLDGAARFEDVIRRAPSGRFHVLPAGNAIKTVDLLKDEDKLNLVLDALDEAYDVIVVVGAHGEMRALFEAIQGRFDAAVVVGETARRSGGLADPPGTLLGFEVTDIEIMRLERARSRPRALQRIIGGGREMELRPA